MNYVTHKAVAPVAAAIVALSTLLTWISAGPISATGTDTDDGKLLLGVALVGTLIASLGRPNFGKVFYAASALAFVTYELIHVLRAVHSANSELASNPFGALFHVSIGAGLWLGFIAALAWTCTESYRAFQAARSVS